MIVHKFIPNSNESSTNEMLRGLGLKEIDDLFSDVPENVRLQRPLRIPVALSEIELEKYVSEKLGRNMTPPDYLNFLGGGVRLHHVPSVIDEILSRGEFYTAYTPYQPEISQGMLQGMFEYQSLICELTSMDVANSSMYDWATALGEAGRMASRATKRKRMLVPGNISPERRKILETYCYPGGIELEEVGYTSRGLVDIGSLESKLDEDVAGIYLENPNFFGIIEESAEDIASIAHAKGALLIVGVDPLTLGVLKPPGRYGADIVVGDGQTMGLYPNFGGPLIGILATRNDPNLLRQMPGRLIGMTNEKSNPTRRGFAMVLQTREQHIRREQATSNICTNEALFAIAVSIYLSSMGPQGIKEIGEQMITKAHFAERRLVEEGIETPFFHGSFFGELSVKTKTRSLELAKRLLGFKILGGLPMERFFAESSGLSSVSLFSFTELHSEKDIELLVNSLSLIERKAGVSI